MDDKQALDAAVDAAIERGKALGLIMTEDGMLDLETGEEWSWDELCDSVIYVGGEAVEADHPKSPLRRAGLI